MTMMISDDSFTENGQEKYIMFLFFLETKHTGIRDLLRFSIWSADELPEESISLGYD